MLQRLLALIQKGQVQSQWALARELGVSPELVSQMAAQLTSQGYLQEAGTCVCDSAKSGCAGCAGAVSIKGWAITDKGRRAAQKALGK